MTSVVDPAASGEFPLLPRMSDGEMGCFARALAGKKTVVEYGCGGSTLFALQQGVSRIFSVESDPQWIERLRAHSQLSAAVQSAEVTFFHADLGPVGDWGFPRDGSRFLFWPLYWRSVWSQIPQPQDVDLVLIDGRFRVACTLFSLMQARRDTVFVIHDFWSRPHYEIVTQFLNCIDACEDIAVFVKKQPLDWPKLATALVDYAYAPE